MSDFSASSSESEGDYELSMSGTNQSNTQQIDRVEQEWKKVAARENVYVNLSRFAVFCTLAAAASVASLYVFDYIRDDQIAGFEESFHANADQIIDKFHLSIKRRLEAVDALSLSITSYVKSQEDMSWPFVTIPDYEIRAANARVLATSYVINFFVVVEESHREAWNDYVNKTGVQHYFESLASDAFQRNALDERLGIGADANGRSLRQPNIFLDRIEESVHQVYIASWQESPVTALPETALNSDLRSSLQFNGPFTATLETGLAVLGPAFVLSPGDSFADYLTYLYSLSQYRDQIEEVAFDPTSTLVYPIFDNFIREERKVVGTLGLNVNWRTIFNDVLASNVKGIYCVLENTFNQTYTFRIDGPKATFLGEGDLHDTSYDRLEQFADATEYLKRIASLTTLSYTSVSLNADFCSFTLKVYPSAATEDFRNQDPLLIALMIVSVFVFTSVIFLVYDFVVGRRQRYVMSRAVTSSAIVSSLFPSQVRAQLYEEKEEENLKHKRGRKRVKDEEMNAMLEKLGGSEDDLLVFGEKKARPIASQFENTTIMFADLAGFTAWSSNHSPHHVFELLETLYGKFDVAARHRRVFKVETIGDCYLAVTGLPNPQPTHAVICARFAHECVRFTNNITRSLSSRLGEDTMDLQLRVGLHTGPVTAGVLRGEKARFQLFGDSVNTASRMESNGLPGRVHLSEATAMELKARGKGEWLKAREDKITVKGKGVMSTYWLNIPQSVSSSGLSSAPSDDASDGDDNEFAVFYV